MSGRALKVLILTIGAISVASAQSEPCKACNCQLRNTKALNKMVEAQMNHTLAKEPLVRMLSIYVAPSRQVILSRTNHTTLQSSDSTRLADITLSDSSRAVTSSNNLLAYRPRFADEHSSNLAGIFINMEGVFPCLQSLTGYYPICKTYTEEDDGFRGGKVLLDSGDAGNSFRVFHSSSNILTYGIAIQDCPEFTRSCLPSYHSFSIICYLPRKACS